MMQSPTSVSRNHCARRRGGLIAERQPIIDARIAELQMRLAKRRRREISIFDPDEWIGPHGYKEAG